MVVFNDRRHNQETSRFPQLGGEAEGRQIISKKTGEPVMGRGKDPSPKIALSFPDPVNLKDPVNIRAAAGNFIHSIEQASPASVASGKLWYPKVHEAVAKGISKRGFMSGAQDKMLSGAGLVAAVSPNMDWDRANIDAFADMQRLKGHHIDTILAADPRGTGRKARASRLAAQEVVAGTSMRAANVGQLQKAARIIRGEDPESVLDPKGGAPKTRNFMHNIADPSNPEHVTIDGRAFDTLTNRLRPWTFGRGISTSTSQRGTTRYQDASDIVRESSHALGLDPSAGQAISWTHTKYELEQKGGTRKQGPPRVGQPYFHPETGEPVLFRRQPVTLRR